MRSLRILSQLPSVSLSLVRQTPSYENDVRQAPQDNDPQSIFYLDLFSPDPKRQKIFDVSSSNIAPTLHYWAAKIERTVLENLDIHEPQQVEGALICQRQPQQIQCHDVRGSAQASWRRAAYRVELLEFLARDTPWLMGVGDNKTVMGRQELTGEYTHDKAVYQHAVHGFLESHVTDDGLLLALQLVERKIVELVLSWSSRLNVVQRFAILVPSLRSSGDTGNPGPLGTFPGLRIVSFAFLREVDAMGKVTVAISPASYEARLNKSLSKKQLEEMEAESQEAGEKLVLHSTVSVVLGRHQASVA